MTTPPKPERFSLTTFISSVRYAVAGLRTCLRSQRNARVHLMAAFLVVLCGAVLCISAQDWRWIAAAIFAVWTADLINTAFEHLCDVVSPAYHDGVKAAKDIAAGAVLVAVVFAVVIGVLTFLPSLLEFLPAAQVH